MKYLLDTHIWIWSHLNPSRLTQRVRKILTSSRNELWLSPISIWEMLVLTERGKLLLTITAEDWIKQALELAPMREAPLTFEIARLSRSVQLSHDDPADRFIAATAMQLDLILITADKRLQNSAGFEVLKN
jgi:PIN domain nuclease of toxin-antitoxin system